MEASQSGLLCVTLLFPGQGCAVPGTVLNCLGALLYPSCPSPGGPSPLAHVWEGSSFPTQGKEEEAEPGLFGIISGCLSICVINFAECQKAEREIK